MLRLLLVVWITILIKVAQERKKWPKSIWSKHSLKAMRYHYKAHARQLSTWDLNRLKINYNKIWKQSQCLSNDKLLILLCWLCLSQENVVGKLVIGTCRTLTLLQYLVSDYMYVYYSWEAASLLEKIILNTPLAGIILAWLHCFA